MKMPNDSSALNYKYCPIMPLKLGYENQPKTRNCLKKTCALWRQDADRCGLINWDSGDFGYVTIKKEE